jgi:glutamate synthase domain-containing protein 2
VLSANVREAILKAAAEIKTCVIMPAAGITPDLEKYSNSIIPLLAAAEIDAHRDAIKKARLAAIEYSEAVLRDLPELKKKIAKIGRVPLIIRVPAVQGVEDIVLKLAKSGAEIVHIAADYRGREIKSNGSSGAQGRLLKDIIRTVHQKLVEDRIRDEVTIIVSGGIAMAEYVVKAMLCGADLTAIDMPLLIALGSRLYEEPEMKLIFPEGLGKIPLPILTQRLVNLMGAWHSQILEMMGAMGIREARRLRGESGRAIFFEEIDRDTFGVIFKKQKAASI